MTWCWLWFWSLVFPTNPGTAILGLRQTLEKDKHVFKPIPLMCRKWSQNQCLPKMPHLLWILCREISSKKSPIVHTVAGTEPGCLSATSWSRKDLDAPQIAWRAGGRDAILEAKLVFYVDVSVTVWCKIEKIKKLEVLMIISGMLHMFFVHPRSLRSLLRWMDGEIDK